MKKGLGERLWQVLDDEYSKINIFYDEIEVQLSARLDQLDKEAAEVTFLVHKLGAKFINI